MAEATSSAQPRILIVEHEAIIALALEDLLLGMGFAVIGMTASASQALESARELRPDAILMDVTLDGSLDGVTAAELIRREVDCPILFTTAHTNSEQFERMQRIPNTKLLSTPFDQRGLERAMIEALRRQR